MPFGEIFGKLMDTLVGGPVVKPFPKEPVKVPPKWRGKPLYDAEDCTGCRQCERVCPPGAITIEDKKGEFFYYKIDYGVCIYCWYCIDACPTTALTGDDKTGLYVGTDRTQERIESGVPYVECPVCGSKVLRPARTLVIRQFKKYTPETLVRASVCPKCRREKTPEEIESAVQKYLEDHGISRD